MNFFCPLRGIVIYREGTKWAKGHLYALMGHLAFHIRALIATVEPGNCPRERGTVKGGGIRVEGGTCSPEFQHPKGALSN